MLPYGLYGRLSSVIIGLALAAAMATLPAPATLQAASPPIGPEPAISARELVDDPHFIAAAQARATSLAATNPGISPNDLFTLAFLQELGVPATESDLMLPSLRDLSHHLTTFRPATGKTSAMMQRMERSQGVIRALLSFLYDRYLGRSNYDAFYLDYWMRSIIITTGKDAGRLSANNLQERISSFLKAAGRFPNAPRPSAAPTAPKPSPTQTPARPPATPPRPVTPSPTATPMPSTRGAQPGQRFASPQTVTPTPTTPRQSEADWKAVFRAYGLQDFPDADVQAIAAYMQRYGIGPQDLSVILARIDNVVADPEQLRSILISGIDNTMLRAAAQSADARAVLSVILTFNPMGLWGARKERVVQEIRDILRSDGLDISQEGAAALLEAGIRRYKIGGQIVEGRLTMIYRAARKFLESLSRSPATPSPAATPLPTRHSR